MLLISFNAQESPLQQGVGLPKMSVVLKLRNPGIWIFKHGGPFKVL